MNLKSILMAALTKNKLGLALTVIAAGYQLLKKAHAHHVDQALSHAVAAGQLAKQSEVQSGLATQAASLINQIESAVPGVQAGTPTEVWPTVTGHEPVGTTISPVVVDSVTK